MQIGPTYPCHLWDNFAAGVSIWIMPMLRFIEANKSEHRNIVSTVYP